MTKLPSNHRTQHAEEWVEQLYEYNLGHDGSFPGCAGHASAEEFVANNAKQLMLARMAKRSFSTRRVGARPGAYASRDGALREASRHADH
jgi:hypothetical protein